MRPPGKVTFASAGQALPVLPAERSMTVRSQRETLIVWTVIGFQEIIVITFSFINLMQAFTLGTDAGLVTAVKTAKMQNEKFRVREIAGEVRLSHQVGSTHSCQRLLDFRRQYADIFRIPCFILERAGAGERRR